LGLRVLEKPRLPEDGRTLYTSLYSLHSLTVAGPQNESLPGEALLQKHYKIQLIIRIFSKQQSPAAQGTTKHENASCVATQI